MHVCAYLARCLPLTMLDLVRAFHGSPSSAFRLHTLCLPTESLLVSRSCSSLACTYASCQLYPSADTVVILNATSLRFLRALAFSQVFPGVGANCNITSLAVDPALKLVRIPPAFSPFPSTSTPHTGSCRIRSEACRLVSFWGLRLHLARSLVARASR
jgi:hypothetical protein